MMRMSLHPRGPQLGYYSELVRGWPSALPLKPGAYHPLLPEDAATDVGTPIYFRHL